jgi:hypothetical protein
MDCCCERAGADWAPPAAPIQSGCLSRTGQRAHGRTQKSNFASGRRDTPPGWLARQMGIKKGAPALVARAKSDPAGQCGAAASRRSATRRSRPKSGVCSMGRKEIKKDLR